MLSSQNNKRSFDVNFSKSRKLKSSGGEQELLWGKNLNITQQLKPKSHQKAVQSSLQKLTQTPEMTMAASAVAFSPYTLEKVAKAKATIENYYTNLVNQHKERRERYYELVYFHK